MDGPEISVVIPTRDRPHHIRACVATVLDSVGVDFDVTVVDQSTDDATANALRCFSDDPRLRHIPTTTRGVAAARNLGVRATRGRIVLFTDDDCRVPPSWVAGVREHFEKSADIGILYGRVELPADSPPDVFAATFSPFDVSYRKQLPRPNEPWGISANMGVRRTIFDIVGYFDEMLGAGGKFPSGAETDLTIRAVVAGETVRHVSDPCVIHVGFREGAKASALIRRYGLGVGAVFAKHLRLRSRPGWKLLATWLWSFGSRGLKSLVLGRRPTGLGLPFSILKGAVQSVRTPIDRGTGVYRADLEPERAAPTSHWDASDGPDDGMVVAP